MPDPQKTTPDTPQAENAGQTLSSVEYETANPVVGGCPAAELKFGPPPNPDEVGTLGPYRVLKELGRGGMGVVFLAFDERLKRKVAIKLMLPKYAANESSKGRFLREARAAAQISHDHIVTIHEADIHDGTPCIAMQYLQGRPLDVYLREKGNLDLSHTLRIGREVALGLAAAHEVGLIHRDIKPGNIWLESPKGRVKILDFGLAKPTQEELGADIEPTASGVVMGTPSYMAPEQALGEKIDRRADLFSLGVILYRLATGHPPFRGDTMMALLTAVVADEPQPVRELNPGVPESLARLIHQLLQKKPDERPNSARDVAESLKAIKNGTVAAISVPTQAVPVFASPTLTRDPAAVHPFADFDLSHPNRIVARPTQTLPPTKPPLPNWPRYVLGGILVPLLTWLILFVFATPKGTLVIESNDPDVEITVKRDGTVLVDKSRGREFSLKVADNYQIEMTEKEGLRLTTNQFAITRNGKRTVMVVAEKAKPVSADRANLSGPDGKAAEYTLLIGGTIGVDDENQELDSLPDRPFKLTKVVLHKAEVDVAGFSVFRGCKNLKHLELSGSKITDAAIANFANNLELSAIILSGTSAHGYGFEQFRECKKLTRLDIQNSPITDAGLKHFPDYESLKILKLEGTNLTDVGLLPFQACQGLTLLELTGSGLTDTGLAYFSKNLSITKLGLKDTKITESSIPMIHRFPNLRSINLSNLPLTSDSIARLLQLPQELREITLEGTEINDGALVSLETKTPKLTKLNVKRTKATEAGVRKLSEKLPRCRIEWDGGIVGDPDRQAAEFALSIRNPRPVILQTRSLKTITATKLEELPNEPFRILGLTLNHNNGLTEEDFANFRGLKDLTVLSFGSGPMMPIGDTALANFSDCRDLTRLEITNTNVTDDGLKTFRGLKKLQGLQLAGAFTDVGLAKFEECLDMSKLRIDNTKISDVGVQSVARRSKGLTQFQARDTTLTDAGLEALQSLKSLKSVDVRGTGVTKAGVERLQASLPNCVIESDFTVEQKK